jgi:hypothetical protein
MLNATTPDYSIKKDDEEDTEEVVVVPTGDLKNLFT